MIALAPIAWRVLRRPVLIGLGAAAIFAGGVAVGTRTADLGALRAENARLVQESAAAMAAAHTASQRARVRERQLVRQNEWIGTYAQELMDRAGQCRLDDDDLERLRRL